MCLLSCRGMLMSQGCLRPRAIPVSGNSILFYRSSPATNFSGLSTGAPLPLAVLESPPSPFLTVLLPLLHARVAREKPVLPQSRPQFRVEQSQCAGKPHSNRAGLSPNSSAFYSGVHFHLILHLCELQRFNRCRVPRDVPEIVVHWTAIHRKARRSRLDIDASHRLPPTSRAVVLLLPCTHRT